MEFSSALSLWLSLFLDSSCEAEFFSSPCDKFVESLTVALPCSCEEFSEAKNLVLDSSYNPNAAKSNIKPTTIPIIDELFVFLPLVDFESMLFIDHMNTIIAIIPSGIDSIDNI